MSRADRRPAGPGGTEVLDLDAIARTLDVASLDATITAQSPPPFQEAKLTLPQLALGSPERVGPPADLVLTEQLGQGGMGEVWLATQRSLGRDVAVKVPRSAGGALGAALVAEARVSGSLEHPNVVPVHVLGLDDGGRPVLVMKRIEGTTLEALRDAAHPEWPAIEQRYGDRTLALLEVAIRVADALELAHERGIIHRDIKPENVMVGRFGEVYLLDWGVALDKRHPPERGQVVGTPLFMAPEMLSEDARGIDARTDVYLLGATLYAAYTGKPRHDGQTLRTVLELVKASDAPVYAADVPHEIRAICTRATAREKDDRYADARALRVALREAIQRRRLVRQAEEVDARLRKIVDTSAPAAALAAPSNLRALSEARFALYAILREWEENEVARASLEATLLAVASAEVARENADEAERALADRRTAAPELAEKVRALRAEIAERRRLEEVGRREERELDPRVARRSLVILFAIMALGVGSTGLMIFSNPNLDMWTITAIDGALVLALLVAAIVGRRRLGANRHGKLATMGLFVCLVGAGLTDVFCAVQGRSPDHSAPFTLLAISITLAASSFATSRRLFGSSLVILAGAAVALARPDWSFAMAALTTMFIVGVSFSEMILPSKGGIVR